MANVRKVKSAKIIIIVLLISSLVFVAALSLNDLMSSLISIYFSTDEIWGKLIYFAVVLGILIAAAYLVHKYFPATEELL